MKIINRLLSVGILMAALSGAPLWAQATPDLNDTVLTHFETNNPQTDIGFDVHNNSHCR